MGIADDAKECRHATTGVKTANRMKTSSTEFVCVANAAKCADANGVQSDNTLKKAKTSASDDLCKTIADDAKECRHATTGVATANKMKTSSTDFVCVADNAAKCSDANGVQSDNTLKKAKTSSSNDVCVTIADDAKSCRHATSGVLVTDAALKKSATDFECVTNAAKCGDANAQLADNTGLKARTSATDATCVDFVDKCKCGSAECVKDDYCATDACIKDCTSTDGSTKSTVKCQCGTKTCAVNDKCKSAD